MMVHPITSVGNAQASAHDGDVAMETSAEVWLRLDQCAAHLPQKFFGFDSKYYQGFRKEAGLSVKKQKRCYVQKIFCRVWSRG